MKRKLLSMLFLLVTSVVAWGQGYNDVRWPNYTATSGTAGHNDNEGYDKLFDNNTSTKWCVTTLGNPTYVQFDATRPIKPTYYTLTTGGDTNKYQGRNPKSWVIKASNDASNWTTIVTVTDGDMPTGNLESKTFSMGNLGTFYRYWRFEVNSVVSGTVFQLSEFSLLVDFTLLEHVFVEGLEDIYCLTPSQGTINPQLTVRDLKGQTLPQNTYWKIGYYTSNNQYLSSVGSPGNYTLVISQGSTIYYSGNYQAPIKVTYGLDGSGTQNDPYTISSWNDWSRFISSINAGKTYADQYVSLLQDIDVEQNSIILPTTMADDDQSHVFSGTFLGNNHTITHTASYDKQVVGLFRWVKGATFKDLTVAGSISSSQKFMAALVGDILGGNVTFDNCHVTATLNSSVEGDGTSAPFVGYQANGSVTFNDCSFTGSLVGPNTTLWSGMMGWGEGAVRAIFSNCIFAPTTVNISDNSGATYARGRTGFTMTSVACYCTHQLSTQQGFLVYANPQEGINKIISAADGNLYHMTCAVSGVESEYTYSGTPIQPVPTVKSVDNTTLIEGTDYTLVYSDPTGRYPGAQTLTINATGGTYVGSTTIAYTVVRDPSLPELKPGDANLDDTLSVADVTTIINIVRGKVASNQWADVDGDNSVTVQDAEIVVAMILGKAIRIMLSNSTLSMRAGQTSQLSVSFYPEGEYTQGITWATSNAQVATVSAEGLVTAVGSGSCVVTCSAYGLTATCEVSVYSADDYVDLGLPSGTLWAKCNVGATEPKGYGSYFAWGETQPKGTYTSANYTKSGISAITAADDAATVNWGAAWQMPTKAEMEELFNSTYTTQEWTTENGITGVRITSKANGNSIFLPATGYYSDYTYAMNTNYSIYYWTSTRATYSANAYHLYGNKNSTPYVDAGSRYYGYSVRPVLVEKAVRATSLTLSKNTLALNLREPAQLTATVLPADTETKTLAWASSDPDVAKVDDNGLVEAVAAGTCTITATTTDGTALSASCAVTVAPILNGHEYVDLGLSSGTLWATTNIGASNPEDSGLYFAWGETTGYAAGDGHDFSWQNYAYIDVPEGIEGYSYDPLDGPFYLSKYNGKYCSYDGIMDNVIDLMAEDDAAFTNWGPNWRLPTGGQISELFERDFTTQTQTTRNGVQGLLFTSKIYPDRSIFIPAARHYGGSDLTFDNEGNIWIWAGTLNDNNSMCPYAWHTAGYDHITTSYRCFGLPVRPVVAYRCVESVTLSATEITCAVGDTIDLTFTLLPADAVDKDVRWIEGNEDVVDVGWDGVITAVAPGKCKITVQARKGGAAACCLVTVVEP